MGVKQALKMEVEMVFILMEQLQRFIITELNFYHPQKYIKIIVILLIRYLKNIIFLLPILASLAQMVEQVICNH